MNDGVILIDTAGPVVGVAAWGKRTFVASERIVAGADGWLTPQLAEALDAAGAVGRIGVVIGPGTFTGLRVGIAHALGLGLALGVENAPISSLALRAAAMPGRERVLSLLDARKGRVYAGWFDTRGDVPVALGPELDVAPEVLISSALSSGVAGSAVATGEGAVVFCETLLRAGFTVADEAARSPVEWGRALVLAARLTPLEQIQPQYIRDSDAVPSVV